MAEVLKSGEAVEPTKGEPMYTIYMAEQDNSDDRQQQFISCNGQAFLIMRGVDVDNVPQKIINVLKESIQTIIDKDAEGNDRIRRIPRFNFNIKEGPYFTPKPKGATK